MLLRFVDVSDICLFVLQHYFQHRGPAGSCTSSSIIWVLLGETRSISESQAQISKRNSRPDVFSLLLSITHYSHFIHAIRMKLLVEAF